jgi:hypothetical protein
VEPACAWIVSTELAQSPVLVTRRARLTNCFRVWELMSEQALAPSPFTNAFR